MGIPALCLSWGPVPQRPRWPSDQRTALLFVLVATRVALRDPAPRVKGQGPDLRRQGAAGGSEETRSGPLPLGLWKDSDLLDEPLPITVFW